MARAVVPSSQTSEPSTILQGNAAAVSAPNGADDRGA